MKNTLLLPLLFLTGFAFSRELDWHHNQELNEHTLGTLMGPPAGNRPPLTIHIWENIQMSGNPLVIPENVTLRFSEGGRIIVGTGDRLVIDGLIDANPQQIFDVTAVSLNNNDGTEIKFTKVKKFYPEWWGLFPNTHESNINFNYNIIRQMMLDIRASGSGHLHFSSGTYFIRDLIIDFDNLIVSGEGASTTLKYDIVYSPTTTSLRQGALIGVMGPTTETHTAGNALWNVDDQIENIILRDFKVDYDHNKLIPNAFDPLTSGIRISNAKNVLVENVSVDIHEANNAFYVATEADREKTENVTIRKCTVNNAVVGVYLSHGFPQSGINRQDRKLANISIENCAFDLKRSTYINDETKFSSGIFFYGTENTDDQSCYLGEFYISDNRIENADFGIRTTINTGANNQNSHKIYIQNNNFYKFVVCGIYGSLRSVFILNNSFDTKVLQDIGTSFDNAAIHIRKDLATDLGLDFISIEGNLIRNLSRADNVEILHGIYLIPETTSLLNINSNYFSYENGILPKNDIKCLSSSQHHNPLGMITYGNNKFPPRPDPSGHVFIEVSGYVPGNFNKVNLGNNDPAGTGY